MNMNPDVQVWDTDWVFEAKKYIKATRNAVSSILQFTQQSNLPVVGRIQPVESRTLSELRGNVYTNCYSYKCDIYIFAVLSV